MKSHTMCDLSFYLRCDCSNTILSHRDVLYYLHKTASTRTLKFKICMKFIIQMGVFSCRVFGVRFNAYVYKKNNYAARNHTFIPLCCPHSLPHLGIWSMPTSTQIKTRRAKIYFPIQQMWVISSCDSNEFGVLCEQMSVSHLLYQH